ncbi:ABC transporter substrate-binding protein [Actinomadura sp. 1N219]|uniref:ABC transporter substrate-binding protein n=1 Tax=Actinomadura sp. 1N219 TaxID=3375152 RepID=UPI00379F1799
MTEFGWRSAAGPDRTGGRRRVAAGARPGGRRRVAGAAAVAVLSLTTAAACGGGVGKAEASKQCTSSASGDTAWAGNAENARALAELCKSAAKAGQNQVVVYGAYAELFRPIWQDFTKRYPSIKIVPKVQPPGATVSAVQSEVSSGRQVGDALMLGLESVSVSADKGLLQPFEPATVDDLPNRYRDSKQRFYVPYGDVYGFMYNKDKMSEADIPKSMADLVSGRLRGFVLDDPALGVISAQSLMPIYKANKLTLDQMRGLKRHGKLVDSTRPYYDRLVTGETTVMPWASYMRHLRKEQAGAPVAFKAVPGLSSLLYGSSAVIKGAPHMEAAKLWASWMLTPEAQRLIASKGLNTPLRPGVETPASWPDYHVLENAMPQIAPENFNRVLQEFLQWAKPVNS